MNSHEKVYELLKSFRVPVSAPTIQADLSPKLSYALVHSCLNDLVRQGKLTESKNEVGKRVFALKE